jgi:putative transposase
VWPRPAAVLGLTSRTLRRWRALAGSDTAPRVPANRLSPDEQEAILTVCNALEYRSLPPTQIVPRLADQGVYLASESSFYRVLRAHDQVQRRGRAAAPRQVAKPQGVCATAPNGCWAWDITFLASSIRGQFHRLYLIEDVFSRKIVGWEVYAEESAEHASRVIQRACLAEAVHRPGLVLHSDNGSPMKGATMLSTLQRLGVVPSFSRPSVSDDSPYAESLFRTLKYTPAYPNQTFASLTDARTWVARCVHWYNEEHRHSKIRFVTPGQRHRREDIAILAHRHQVYQDAQRADPLVAPHPQLDTDRSCLTQPTQGACTDPKPNGRSGRMNKRTTMLTNPGTQTRHNA